MSAPFDSATGHSFLKAELELGFTFSTIASQRFEIGYEESAGKSLVNAEKACETVSRFLSDPKHSRRLSDAEIHDLSAELGRLRERLVKLDQFRSQRRAKGSTR
jgi:hypothetical protein